MAEDAGLQPEVRPSLGETLSAAFDEAKVDASVETTPVTSSPSEPVKVEAKTEPKVDATGRVHAPDGKFAPGQAPSPGTAPAAPAPGSIRPKRPDSWAKEHWEDWEKLDPKLAEYLHKREGQYLQGVTTYKQEYEKFKPVADALTPYQQEIQAVGGAPQFIKALAETHRTLSGQDPQAKLRAFARFAKDYQIPLEQLLVQGDDGKVYLNQQLFQDQPQAAQSVGPQEIEKIVQANLAKVQLQNLVANFVAEKDEGGKPKYPHFEKVKASMDGLLRSGLVRDLPSAYHTALNLPQHAEIADADRLQRETETKAAEAKAKEDAAARAKANVISPRNQAPQALIPAGSGKKGLRSQLSDAFDASTGGRV